jgi:hypothetical protein
MGRQTICDRAEAVARLATLPIKAAPGRNQRRMLFASVTILSPHLAAPIASGVRVIL